MTRTEMVIKMQGSSEKGHSKAMKVAAAIDGVESVTLSGEKRNLLRVVGDGVDCNHLTSRLRRKVGHADIVELRTLQQGRGYGGAATTSGARVSGAGGGYYPSQLAAGARYDVAYGGSQYGSGYPTAASGSSSYAAPYYHQPYDYYSQPAYGNTVVHHEYTNSDPNNCSIM